MENENLIAKAVDYVKRHATDKEITVQEIASHAGFSMDYFNRIFLSHTGFTAMSYVSYIRLKKALELLRNTNKSLLDIALEVGYDSHEGFLKAFKKEYDITPSEYRRNMKNKVLSWGELTDESIAARFVFANPDFCLIDSHTVIDYLLETNPKRYGYFCSTIKSMGLRIAAPGGCFENGFIGIGDDRKGGCYLELMTDDFSLLAEWIKQFPDAADFYSACGPTETRKALEQQGVTNPLVATPQALFFGSSLPCSLPDTLQIRLLTPSDIPQILKWSNGKRDGYIHHLLNERHYDDESVLEYGVFQNKELIAVAGCGIEEIHGLRLNNCCAIRFTDGQATDELYRTIFSFVVNAVIEKGLIPFDDLQYGEYARTHGKFTSAELGFEIVNWRYDLSNR